MSHPLPRIRVAAVIVEKDNLLLVRHEKDGETYWMLPGGGVDFGEPLDEALRRELREEVAIEAQIGPLLFVNDSIPEDRHRHIVNIYFAARIVAGRPALGEDERIVEVAFHPLTTLDTLALRPRLQTLLKSVVPELETREQTYLGNLWLD